LIGQRNQFAIDAQMWIVADLEVQIGSAPLHGDAKQIIDIHSRVPLRSSRIILRNVTLPKMT